MAESKKTVEARWWREWFNADYSWEGLVKYEIHSNGFSGLYGEKTLQDYWRRDPATGLVRTDAELKEAGELVDFDGRWWHVIHLPPRNFAATHDTWKIDPVHPNWARIGDLVAHRLIAAQQTEGFFSNSETWLSHSHDGRALLDGGMIGSALDHYEAWKIPIHLSCIRAKVDNLSRIKRQFGPGVCFNGAFFCGEARFDDAIFAGGVNFIAAVFFQDVKFSDAIFSNVSNFERVIFARSVDFGKSVFIDNVDFNSVAFYEEANFSNVNFSRDVRFDIACFFAGVDLGGARFSESAKFSGTAFSGIANFKGVVFSGVARFDKTVFSTGAEFDNATFSAAVGFDYAVLGVSSFDGVVFSGPACFDMAAFGKASFNGAAFSSNAGFDIVAFHGVASFSGAAFSGDTGFNRAAFSSRAAFDRVIFSAIAGFNLAAFSEGVNFGRTKFCSTAGFNEANFSCSANFGEVLFSGEVDFGGALFSAHASFGNVTFSEYADFHHAKFLSGIDFTGAKFRSKIDFNGVDFLSIAKFNGVTFRGDAIFSKTTFLGAVAFNRAIFEKRLWLAGPDDEPGFGSDAVVSFRSALFKGAVEFSSAIAEPEQSFAGAFHSARFLDIADFSNAVAPDQAGRLAVAFEETQFEKALILTDGADRVARTYFRDVMLPRTLGAKDGERKARLRQLEAGCRTIKIAMGKARDELREQRYYRLQLIARQQRSDIDLWEKAYGFLYGLASDFGSSLWRPLAWLGVLTVVAGLGYFAWAAWLRGADPGDFWEAQGMALTAVFKPFSTLGDAGAVKIAHHSLSADLMAVNPAVAMGVRVATLVQSLLSGVLIFLFGLAVKRRFQIS